MRITLRYFSFMIYSKPWPSHDPKCLGFFHQPEEIHLLVTSFIWSHLLLPPEVHVEPHKKQLHVTLAYNFPSDHLSSLEKLAKGIEVKLGCDWLAVLFSRDIRFANHEVHFNPITCECLNCKWSRAMFVPVAHPLTPSSLIMCRPWG